MVLAQQTLDFPRHVRRIIAPHGATRDVGLAPNGYLVISGAGDRVDDRVVRATGQGVSGSGAIASNSCVSSNGAPRASRSGYCDRIASVVWVDTSPSDRACGVLAGLLSVGVVTIDSAVTSVAGVIVQGVVAVMLMVFMAPWWGHVALVVTGWRRN
jgi:hypothetical protein